MDWAERAEAAVARYRGRREPPRSCDRRRPAPAPADAPREHGLGGRPQPADGRPPRRGERVAAARGGALPRELAGCAARLVGPADRRDEGAAARGRRRSRAPRGGRSTPARPTRRLRSGATRARSRCSCSAATPTRARSRRPCATATTFRATSPTRSRRSPQPIAPATSSRSRACSSRSRRATEFLEDIPVADTVLVLQLLAAQRDVAVDLPASPRLP